MSRRAPISDAMIETFWQLAPVVLERYGHDGRADRRETAVLTLFAGLVPATGFLVLDWAPGTVLACTFINLALLLVDDLAKSALASGGWRSVAWQAAEDDYVWALGLALLRGDAEVRQELAAGVQHRYIPMWGLLPLALIALLVAGFNILLTVGKGAVIPYEAVAWGSAPNLLLMLATYGAGVLVKNPHWRRAGSARHGSAIEGMQCLFLLAFFSMVLIHGPTQPDSYHLPEETTALLASSAATGLGAWRLYALANRDAVARWLGWRPKGKRRSRQR